MFFQRLALAFAALQGAESWFPVPGVSSADPRPGARGLRRDSAGLTGSPKRPWPVLVAGRCSRARTCARIPDGPCGLRWSPLSLVLRPPAPSCSAHKSAAETPGLHPIPHSARDQPRTTPVCSCARCRWLGSSSNVRGEAIFWADLQKISTRGVITMLEHHSRALPPPSLSFLYRLDFPGKADADRIVLLTWPHLFGRGVGGGVRRGSTDLEA